MEEEQQVFHTDSTWAKEDSENIAHDEGVTLRRPSPLENITPSESAPSPEASAKPRPLSLLLSPTPFSLKLSGSSPGIFRSVQAPETTRKEKCASSSSGKPPIAPKPAFLRTKSAQM